jgi:protease-4
MSKRNLAPLLAVTLLALASAPARGQHKTYTRATEGVLLPSPSVTEVNDATALSVNPANLGFLDSWSFTYAGAWVDDQDHIAGQGHGLFFGFPLGPLGFGIATEFLLPPAVIRETWQGLDDRIRFSLGLGVDLQRAVGIGLAYRTFFRYDLGEIDTFDLALTVRPANQLALSFVVSDVNRPVVGYQQVSALSRASRSELAPRRFNVGLTVRPLGNDRLALGGELLYLAGLRDELGNETNRTDATAILTAMIVDGLTLRARFGAEGLRDDQHENGYFIDGSLAFDFRRMGFEAGGYYRVNPKDGRGFEGAAWAVRFSGDEAPAIPVPKALRPYRAAVFDIDKKPDSYRLAALLELLDGAVRDPAVDVLVLRPRAGSLGLTEAQELRRRILAFRQEGRRSVCYLEEATSAVYQACAAADEVWINPAGGVRLAGISTTSVYFKDLLDKIGVFADIVRIGEYKSAPEAFTRQGPTDEAALAVNRLLDSTYGHVLGRLTADRKFSDPVGARRVIEGGPYTASEALAAGLVDRLVGADQFEDELNGVVDGPLMVLEDYGGAPARHRTYLDSPAVAVVHIDGDLVDGESVYIPLLDIRMTGAVTVRKVLRELAGDPRIHAVLLRVDSPGGSALASDLIWREVMALRARKPVVASLGAVAASGGYCIASAADEIWSEPTTLTGSIGIFYGKADVSGLLGKIGVGVTTFKRGERADMESWTRAYTPDERRRLLGQIREYYNLFLDRVVEGRGRGFNRQIVDKRGRGRLWSGADAKRNLLVDELGGYLEALDRARELGGVKRETRVFHLPKEEGGLLIRLARRVKATIGDDPSPLDLLFSAAETRQLLRAALPFASADAGAPRARLPFAIIDGN